VHAKIESVPSDHVKLRKACVDGSKMEVKVYKPCLVVWLEDGTTSLSFVAITQHEI